MVGHTGVGRDRRRARDDRRVPAPDRRGGGGRGPRPPTEPGALLAITADHGNAEYLRDSAGNPVTAHSLNPVPFVLVGRAAVGLQLHDGVLADVAPTLLAFAGLPRWPGMTGQPLVGCR